MKILIFLLFFTGVALAQNSDSALDALGNKLFSSVCTEDQYTDWTRCIWPQRELHRMVEVFLHSAKDKECKIPPRPMIREASNEIKKHNVSVHPLYRKIPGLPCGLCSRRAKCCKTAPSFLMQSFKSESCEPPSSPPCTFSQITDDLVAELRPWYPNLTFNSDRCDFTQYTRENLKNLKAQKAWKAVKPLLCQLLGTSDPKINCVSVGNECKCCCYQHIYQDGKCVPQTNAGPTDC